MNNSMFVSLGTKICKEMISNDIGTIVYYTGDKPTHVQMEDRRLECRYCGSVRIPGPESCSRCGAS